MTPTPPDHPQHLHAEGEPQPLKIASSSGCDAAEEPTPSLTFLDFPYENRLQWDELLEQTSQMFDIWLSLGDSSNAIACYNRLAPIHYATASSVPEFRTDLPAVVSAFQPKSGGTFLHNRMLQMGYLEFWWCMVHRSCNSVCYASDEALRLYLQGGCACHTHARPHPNITGALDRHRIEKVWVHLRNPAECALSSCYHFRGEGQGGGKIGEERCHQALAQAQQIGFSPNEELESQLSRTIGWHVDWTAEWLHYARLRPERVVFSFYDELTDVAAMMRRVYGAMGLAPPGAVTGEITERDRFRQKQSNNWRDGLSEAAQRHIEERVRWGIGRYPQFARLWEGVSGPQSQAPALAAA